MASPHDINLNEIFVCVQDICLHMFSDTPREKVNDILRKAVDFITRSLCQNENENMCEREICQRIQLQLTRLRRVDFINRFNDLFSNLKQLEAQGNYEAILNFLCTISEDRWYSSSVPEVTHVPMRNTIRSSRSPKSPDMLNSSHSSSDILIQNRTLKSSNSEPNNSFSSVISIRNPSSASSYYSSPSKKCENNFLPTSVILSDLFYSFRGHHNSDLFRDDGKGGHILNSQYEIQNRSIIVGLLEVGYLHDRVVHKMPSLKNLGSIGQAVHVAMIYQVTQYYRLVNDVQNTIEDSCDLCSFSESFLDDHEDTISDFKANPFRKLMIMMKKPTNLLIILCDAIEAVLNGPLGGIISRLHLLSHHGNSSISEVFKCILKHAGEPVVRMMKTWLVRGELHDPHNEFFITSNQDCEDGNVWHNKFLLRSDRIPDIISKEQADIVLRSGKAIHFLNVICDEKVPIYGNRDTLNKLEEFDLMSMKDSGKLATLVKLIFEETSELVLNTLTVKFKLFQHFVGLKKYILLSQGDFATYLMDSLEPEMKKSVDSLQNYKLNSMLRNAVASSSAVHEDPDIIDRVSIRLLPSSSGDSGYDVLRLHYFIEDHIDMAFHLDGLAYSKMFSFVWKAKRMWHVLQGMVRSRWSSKTFLNRLTKFVPEVKEVVDLADRLSMELVHFARNFNYYLMFEVIECVWEQFSKEFKKAKSFDDLIGAHDCFITSLQVQTFQDETCENLVNDFRLIWGLVIDAETLGKCFFDKLQDELMEYEKWLIIEERDGRSFESEVQEITRNEEFHIYLSSIRAQYTIILRNYQEVVKKLLLKLSRHSNYGLRLLSLRLDYNEYYKRSDDRITESMKFSQCSDMFKDLDS